MSEEEFDRRLGAVLRTRRMAFGMSQTALGKQLGVSFQQVQKYERGASRVAASRLWAIAACLGTRVDALLAAVAAETPDAASNAPAPEKISEVSPKTALNTVLDPDMVVSERQIVALVAAYRAIPHARMRRAVLDMVRACASGSAG